MVGHPGVLCHRPGVAHTNGLGGPGPGPASPNRPYPLIDDAGPDYAHPERASRPSPNLDAALGQATLAHGHPDHCPDPGGAGDGDECSDPIPSHPCADRRRAVADDCLDDAGAADSHDPRGKRGCGDLYRDEHTSTLAYRDGRAPCFRAATPLCALPALAWPRHPAAPCARRRLAGLAPAAWAGRTWPWVSQ